MKKTQAAMLALALLAGALLTGCGAASRNDQAMSAMEAADDYYDYYDDYWEEEAAAEPAYAANSESFGASYAARSLSAETANSAGQSQAKIIYTASLRLESLEFDEAAEGLDALTEACGGYYGYSSLSDNGAGVRYAEYTVRVPAENFRRFMDGAGALCHVLSAQEYTEDVSESYYDTEGRVQTQRIKLERLQDLLEQASYMEDIISLENAISETEELIDRLTGQLRHYDALVDYSTVEIYLSEVKEMTVLDEEEQPFGERMAAAFSEGWESFSGSMEDIAVFFAYSWQWLIIAAVIVVVIILLVKRLVSPKKSRAGKKSAGQKTPAPRQAPPAPADDPAKNGEEK